MPRLGPTWLLLVAVLGCEASGTLGPPHVGVATPTYHRDVAPIVERWCARCHHPEGAGPFDLTEPLTVLAMAEQLLGAIDAGRMPPPAADPDCRPYLGHAELTLPPEARDTLAAWIATGTTLGDPTDRAPQALVPTSLADPDLIVQLPTAYRPRFDDAQDPGNEYRCFALPHGRDEDFYITALAPVLDAEPLVHHIVLFRIGEGSLWPDYDPAVGVDCIDDMEASVVGMIAGWAPGAMPVTFPEGTGIKVLANQRIGMQIHYFENPAAPGRTDRSGYAFRTVDSVQSEVRMVPVGTTNFTIPAGDAAYTRTGSWGMPFGITPTLHGVFPHMHRLGSAFSMWKQGADGSEECLVDLPQFTFENQQTYLFDWPVRLEEGDRVGFSCTWDNSADNPAQDGPPQERRYGERTDEEMCYGFSFVEL